MSGIYIAFSSVNKKVPPEYILKLLKAKQYLRVVEAYDTKYGAVRANLTYEMLCKIKIPILPKNKLDEFLKGQMELNKIRQQLLNQEKSLDALISDFADEKKIIKSEPVVKDKKVRQGEL